jgi:formate C-acetyltransferase
MKSAWKDFSPGRWMDEINVRDFIRKNITPYEGDESFLQGPTSATQRLWDELLVLMREENARGILDADTSIVSSITAHGPGYINRDLEKIVGIQTERPLKRAIMPSGGLRMVESALKAYNLSLDPHTADIFRHYRKTHNDGVFDAYTREMKNARRSAIITGLPDAYGRGRIIGDYRRVPLYGLDKLIEAKQRDSAMLEHEDMESPVIRMREEISEQIRSLEELRQMAASYGFDLGRPAESAQEAIQWLYLAYLAATKEQNGAAMSIGRTSSFIDIYIERDLKRGLITEPEAQELIDHFVMKLRIIRFLRAPEYNELFSGDPVWITEAVGGMGINGKTLVPRTSFRILHTLYNLGPAPEPTSRCCGRSGCGELQEVLRQGVH